MCYDLCFLFYYVKYRVFNLIYVFKNKKYIENKL